MNTNEPPTMNTPKTYSFHDALTALTEGRCKGIQHFSSKLTDDSGSCALREFLEA
jgi:hypothetical protein